MRIVRLIGPSPRLGSCIFTCNNANIGRRCLTPFFDTQQIRNAYEWTRRENMRKAILKSLIITIALLFIAGVVLFALVWNGVLLLNGRAARDYPVKGVDVSSYQGEIDWRILSSADLSFAFIKATEGSSAVDKCFARNFEEAQKTGLAVGAYHFFSYDSSGAAQAENFINTVEPYEGMLPPVVDLEFYGDKEKNPPDKAEVDLQLKTMLETLRELYGLPPILYATEKSYELYLFDGYEEYDIWIRNVITNPKLADGRDWTFWQYTNRARLDGYHGDEKYIDVNVFHGSTEDFQSYPKYRKM